jgi:hypothetical protein
MLMNLIKQLAIALAVAIGGHISNLIEVVARGYRHSNLTEVVARGYRHSNLTEDVLFL